MDKEGCQVHKLIADVCVMGPGSTVFVRYQDTSGYDGEAGWFLPDDYLRHAEHPEEAAARILKEQTGLASSALGLSHIESFEGNGSWHLIFHYWARVPGEDRLEPGRNVSSAEWFPLDQLPEADQVAHGGWGLETLRTALLKVGTG